MTNYETIIKLPGGKIYDKNPEYGGDIKLSMLTTKHEKKIFGSSSFDSVLRDVIKDVTNPSIDIEKLTTADRFYLLIELRKHTYGEKYHVVDECEVCGKVSEFEVDLNDMEIVDLPEDFESTINIKLPKSGDEITLRMLTYGDSLAIRKRALKVSKEIKVPASELEYGYNLEKMIVAVNGEDLEPSKKPSYINNIVGMDAAYISHSINKLEYGYTGKIPAVCPACGSDITVNFEINTEFFRPRFD